MYPSQFLAVERISNGLEVTSKKRLLQTLAELLASGDEALSAESVLESLLERERLGSTGLGHGVAIPHSRMREVGEPRCAFVQLRTGIDYDAIDDEPVSLALGLLVPAEANETHLQLLSALAAMFSDAQLRRDLGSAVGPAEVLALIQVWEGAPRRP